MEVAFSRLGSAETVLLRLERGESAIVLSDTHLGLRVEGGEASNYRSLGEFFRLLSQGMVPGVRRPSAIVLLGDILELWQARVNDVLQQMYFALGEMLALDSVPKIYVAGNHDKLISRLVLRNPWRGDIIVEPNGVIVESCGLRAYLTHGHQFDSFFRFSLGLWKLETYIYSLSEALESLPGLSEWGLAVLSAAAGVATLSVALLLPVPSYLKPVFIYGGAALLIPICVLSWRALQTKFWYLLALPLSSTSLIRSRLRGKTVDDVLQVRGAVSKFIERLKKAGINALVFGHTHEPGMVEVDGFIIANTGSWVKCERCDRLENTFIEIVDGELRLYRWTGRVAELLAVTRPRNH